MALLCQKYPLEWAGPSQILCAHSNCVCILYNEEEYQPFVSFTTELDKTWADPMVRYTTDNEWEGIRIRRLLSFKQRLP